MIFRGTYWGLKWRQWEPGREHLVHEDFKPVLFSTRAQARIYNESRFGYIRTREDLKRPPHCWRMAVPVKVQMGEAMANAGQSKSELVEEVMRLRQRVSELESEVASWRAIAAIK